MFTKEFLIHHVKCDVFLFLAICKANPAGIEWGSMPPRFSLRVTVQVPSVPLLLLRGFYCTVSKNNQEKYIKKIDCSISE